MKAEETKELLKVIKLAYDRFEVTKERAQFWHDSLKDYDFKPCFNNLKKHVATNKFPPTIADLIEGQYREQRNYDAPPSEGTSKEELERIRLSNEKFKEEHGVYPHEYYGKLIREKLSRP